MKRRPLILVADDEVPILKLLSVSFMLEGYDVITADTGPGALQAFQEHQPDLVLLDIGMPGIDGFEVLSSIRQHSDVPVIMMTARDDPAYQRRAEDAGADNFLNKPFDLRELMGLVRARLKPSRSGVSGNAR